MAEPSKPTTPTTTVDATAAAAAPSPSVDSTVPLAGGDKPAAPAAPAADAKPYYSPDPVENARLAAAFGDRVHVEAARKLKIGDKKFFRAVYGLMINPLNEKRFTQESITPCVIDSWVITQFEAGKLAEAQPE